MKKKARQVYNMTDIAESWGRRRGVAHLHFSTGNIEPPTHFRINKRMGIEWLWDYYPPKPEKRKPWDVKKGKKK